MNRNNIATTPGPGPLVQATQEQPMIVVSSTVLDAATWKWTYQVRPAFADADAPFGAVAKSATYATSRALSISEMGNTTTHVCGGVPVAQLPAGYAPVKLHDGCAVWCKGWRDEDGIFFWAIVSPTQAISGVCP